MDTERSVDVQQQKSLDGTYTRMIRKALNIYWQEHFINRNLYGKLPLNSSKIKSRWINIAGNCIRHPELSVRPLILWEPTRDNANRGHRRLNYVDILRKYTGLLEKYDIC